MSAPTLPEMLATLGWRLDPDVTNCARDIATDTLAVDPPGSPFGRFTVPGRPNLYPRAFGTFDEAVTAAYRERFPTPTPPPERAAVCDLGALRPEVRAFALLMEAKLRANDHKGGWKGDTTAALMQRLAEEVAELGDAAAFGKTPAWGYDGSNRGERRTLEQYVAGIRSEIGREAADVANFAMMIADVCGALKTAPALTDPRDAELADLHQRVCDFQAASMLDVGGQGGPCLVEPRHVERHITDLRAELAKVTAERDAAEDRAESAERRAGDAEEVLGDIAQLCNVKPDGDVLAGVEALYRSNGDNAVAFGFVQDENKRLRAELAELRAQACRYYNADGTYEVLASPEAVVERRIAAAAEIAEGWRMGVRIERADVRFEVAIDLIQHGRFLDALATIREGRRHLREDSPHAAETALTGAKP